MVTSCARPYPPAGIMPRSETADRSELFVQLARTDHERAANVPLAAGRSAPDGLVVKPADDREIGAVIEDRRGVDLAPDDREAALQIAACGVIGQHLDGGHVHVPESVVARKRLAAECLAGVLEHLDSHVSPLERAVADVG